jgi:hypothetical protein
MRRGIQQHRGTLLRPNSRRRGITILPNQPLAVPPQCGPRRSSRSRVPRARRRTYGGARTTGGFGGPPLWRGVATHLRCGRHHGTRSLARTHCRGPMKHSATHWRHSWGPIGALSGRTHTSKNREPHDTRMQQPQLMGRPCAGASCKHGQVAYL